MGFSLGGIVKSVINPMTLAQLAMGPAGWASLAMRAVVQSVMQQVVQNIGQQLGLPQSVISLAQGAVAGQMDPNGALNLAGQGSGAAADLFRQFAVTDQGQINRGIDNIIRSSDALATRLQGSSDAARLVYEQAAAAVDSARANGASERTIERLEARADRAQESMAKMDDFLTSLNLSNARRKGQQSMKDVMNGKGSLLMKIAILLGMIADQKMSEMATKAEQIGKMGEIKGKNQAKFTQMNAELQALGQELGTVSQATANVIKSIGEAGQSLARKG